MRKLLLLTSLFLALPAVAQAHIFPLSRSGPTFGTISYGYKPGVAPLEGGSLGFINPNGPILPAWYRITVAWNSQTDQVLVGCRGHAIAYARVRSVHRVINANIRYTITCRNHQAWQVALNHVTTKDHVYDDVLIQTVARRG